MMRHSQKPDKDFKEDDACKGCGDLIINTDDFWYCGSCKIYKLCMECRKCKKKHAM